MRVLLDEDVPEQAMGVLRHLLRGHTVTQLDDPDETRQIKKSGLHHICYGQRVDGLRGLALAIAAIVAAMPAIVDELAVADGQRLVSIHGLATKRRYDITDPKRNPPRYWPR